MTNYPWTWAGIAKDEAPGREEGQGHAIEINPRQPKESKYTTFKIDTLDFEVKCMTRNEIHFLNIKAQLTRKRRQF